MLWLSCPGAAHRHVRHTGKDVFPHLLPASRAHLSKDATIVVHFFVTSVITTWSLFAQVFLEASVTKVWSLPVSEAAQTPSKLLVVCSRVTIGCTHSLIVVPLILTLNSADKSYNDYFLFSQLFSLWFFGLPLMFSSQLLANFTFRWFVLMSIIQCGCSSWLLGARTCSVHS